MMTQNDDIGYWRIARHNKDKAKRFKELAEKKVESLLGYHNDFTVEDLNEMDRIQTPYFHLEINGIPLKENER